MQHTNAISGQAANGAVQRFSRWTIATHWVSALAMLILFSSIWAREYIEEYALRVRLFEMHRQMGLVILTLFFVRVAVKKFGAKKKPSGPQMGRIERLAATCSHVALYIVLFLMPMIGWLITNAQGHAVRFLGAFTLPQLIGKSEDIEDILLTVHEYGADLLVGMISLHFAAAMFHHFVKKDHVLLSMIPLVDAGDAVPHARHLTRMDTYSMQTMPTALDAE